MRVPDTMTFEERGRRIGELEATTPDDLRAVGWSVAVHNDYRQGGERRTFWLLTHPEGRWMKGEGRTDACALNQIRNVLERPDGAGGE